MKARPGLLLGLLTGLNFFNYIDRYVLFGVQPLIQAEFKSSDTAMGFLTTAFFLCYMFAAPCTGYVADRFNRRWVLFGGAFLWSGATLLTAATHTYQGLLVRHVIVGIGEATFGVLAPVYVADLYSEELRGKMLSILYLAIPMGSALGYELGGLLGTRYGWRVPFYVAAVPGVLITLAIWLFTKEPKRGAADHMAVTPERASFSGLLRNPAFWTATLGMAMMTFAMGGISVWMPTFLSRERGMSLARANYLFGLITVVNGFAGTMVGGWLADRLLKRTHKAFYAISAISMLLALPVAVFSIFGPRAGLMPAIAAAEFLLFLNTGPLNAAIVNSVSAQIRATALAVNLFVIHLLGDAISPTIMGRISDSSSLATSFIAAFVAMGLSAALLFYGMRFAPMLQSHRAEHEAGAFQP